MNQSLNYQSIFEAVPGSYLLLSKELMIVGVSDNYCKDTMTKREDIVGKNLFDIFPDNPNDPDADGVSNLRASLNYVLAKKEQHRMAIQKYDIRGVDGSFEERYWSPLNKPVLNSKNEIECIIHSVEDVTQNQKQLTQSRSTELLLRSSIESLKDMVILSIDRNFNYLNFNTAHQKATEQVYGIKIQPGMNLLDHIAGEEDRKQAKNNFERAFAGEWHTTIEQYGTVERIYFETRYNPIINDEGEIIGATAFAVNITERINTVAEVASVNRKLEETVNELERSNELFSKLFDLNPASIVISRMDNFHMYAVNAAFLQMFGFKDKEEVLGKTAEELNLIVDPEFRTRIIDDLKKKGKADNMQGKVRTNDGRELWIASHVHPVEILGVKYTLAVTLDITTLKEQSKLLAEQAEKLNIINQELEAFSYSVSHDLKAPLRALQGFSRALHEDYHQSFHGESLRWLQFIESNANRMGMLIDDILNFSRVGRTNLQITEVNMDFLAKDVFDMERLQYEGKRIQFDVGILPSTKGDTAMLKLVWQNLISNALKYSSRKDFIHIQVTGKTENGLNIFTVKDNGTGFDEKYKEKLFGVFQRLHSNEEFEGTGVGLAIANKIIYKHGGWITASGVPDKGAEFSFAIPI